MHSTRVIGVDPGLVHTGVVALRFEPVTHTVHVDSAAIAGPDEQAVREWIHVNDHSTTHVFIEGYKPRSNLSTDPEMMAAVQRMRSAFAATVLLNTGVKKVVRQPLMELLGCWKFSTVTHHQDLRSAARIALLGMLKSEHLNRVVKIVVQDHVEGRPWVVHA